jgi:hypothetical protein
LLLLGRSVLTANIGEAEPGIEGSAKMIPTRHRDRFAIQVGSSSLACVGRDRRSKQLGNQTSPRIARGLKQADDALELGIVASARS